MSERGRMAEADATEAQGDSRVNVDSPAEPVPFDTFPPGQQAQSATDAAAGRFDDALATGTHGAIRPGSRRAQRLAEASAESSAPSEPASFRVRDFRPPVENEADEASSVPQPSPTPDAAAAAGRPLTRRELRALEAARAREAEAQQGGAEPISAEPISAEPISAEPISAEPISADPISAEATGAGPSNLEATGAEATAAEPTDAVSSGWQQGFDVSSVPEQPEPAASAWQPPTVPPPLVEPPRVDLVPPTYVPSALDLPGRPIVESEPTPEPRDETQDTPVGPPAAPSLHDLEPPVGAPLGTSPTQIPSLSDFPPPPAPPQPPTPPAPPDQPNESAAASETDTGASFVPQYSLAQYPPPTMLPDSVESARGIDFAAQQQAPLGHWSTQEAIDDANQGGASVTSRDVSTSSGPITSNALVLPAIPEGSDLSVPFSTSTGEVLITGSIALPPTLGTTGAHPARYDHSDLDAIIDAVDRDDVEGDSAPVRAIRAVSTHTSPRDVISMSRQSGGAHRLPIVLAITAGSMMVSVTVLVVVGFITDAF
ncbi:hypothetical protein OH146_02520 [Salinibacterium sp. SYSU T00001]|uniref:hypothetical protein n=1 Tax=Homoserinimonas sedimenticola TaxID=2986805 RepID=UPI0022355DAC|nr:hypothetical protein [Salinibacterium sedimenticola]MCW4384643.1 hypothetical protein [Salinibacterium sedimenticola]